MPGAGGRKAANYMYHRARPDGLTLANIGSGHIISAVLGETGVDYDIDKFIYLGTPNTGSHYIFITMSRLGLKLYRQASGSCRIKYCSPRSGP